MLRQNTSFLSLLHHAARNAKQNRTEQNRTERRGRFQRDLVLPMPRLPANNHLLLLAV